jgi:glycosyltransferase involved in cell wall biosynthesis
VEKITNVGLVTPVMTKSGINPVLNQINILESCVNHLSIIEIYTSDASLNVQTFDNQVNIQGRIKHYSGNNIFNKVLNYVSTETKVTWLLLTKSKHIKLWIFFGDPSPLPLLVVKLFRKKIMLIAAASTTQILNTNKDKYSRYLSFIFKINYFLFDSIVVYSTQIIQEWNLEKFSHKIHIAHEHFIDLNKLRIYVPFKQRDECIGYIGRLSQEKGIFNLVEAIPDILEVIEPISVLIGGDGPLRGEIENILNEKKLNGKVKLTGWITHDNLPICLNKLKLIILPSYTEGLPNIMLEALACGTVVLATAVGAIPDFIKDGKTGFIMENNSPGCIARNVIRVLNHPKLEKITDNGRDLVENEFTYKKAVDKFREILSNI